MENKQIPQDILDAANARYPENLHYIGNDPIYGQEDGNEAIRDAYIEWRMEERAAHTVISTDAHSAFVEWWKTQEVADPRDGFIAGYNAAMQQSQQGRYAEGYTDGVSSVIDTYTAMQSQPKLKELSEQDKRNHPVRQTFDPVGKIGFDSGWRECIAYGRASRGLTGKDKLDFSLYLHENYECLGEDGRFTMWKHKEDGGYLTTQQVCILWLNKNK